MSSFYASHPATPAALSSAKGLHLLTMSTPNGQKAQIALEEIKESYGTDFTWTHVDIMSNIQKEPWFLRLGGNGRIPVLVDNSVNPPFCVQESGAILLYLAKKYDADDKFGFKDELERNQCIQMLFFQNAGVGPMQGQYNHFNVYAKEKLEYPIKRYHDETLRLYSVLEDVLSGKYSGQEKEYLSGNGKGKYSWADMSTIGWIAIAERSGLTKEELKAFPHLMKWVDRIKARPAVKKGLENYNKP